CSAAIDLADNSVLQARTQQLHLSVILCLETRHPKQCGNFRPPAGLKPPSAIERWPRRSAPAEIECYPDSNTRRRNQVAFLPLSRNGRLLLVAGLSGRARWQDYSR